MPHEGQQIDERLKLLIGHVRRTTLVKLSDWRVEIVNYLPASRRDSSRNQSAVFIVSRPGDEASFFHSVEQARDVGHTRQHSVAQLVPT